MPETMPLVKPPPKIAERKYITRCLVSQDDNIGLLQSYFKEMQKTTVETSNPEDFLSFASCAHFFGVVMLETTTTPVEEEELSDEDPDAEGEPESEDISELIYPASSRATSPPTSNMSSAASNSSMRVWDPCP
ncbi:hypothetical protein BDZ97DRAFT_127253 [Flammula alnicola]|nr:hypothetical protein BDZ97DRAFT_127253 [Flammula alnicola]